MWFWLALITIFFWSGADFFSKIGCMDEKDKYSQHKMMTAIGLVMGLQAFYEIVINGTVITGDMVLRYIPIGFFYIASMTMGYLDCKYIELSISSPVENSSGAVVAALAVITGTQVATGSQIMGAICASVGVIGIGIVEVLENKTQKQIRQSKGIMVYRKTLLGFILSVGYCFFDAFATFGDSILLQTYPERSVNAIYELFLFAWGVIIFIYVKFIKKQKFTFKEELPKYAGAAFETAGQFAYIHAISYTSHVALVAPMISAYGLLSAIWGHIFLKERLSPGHYVMVLIALVGIVLLGMTVD